MKLLFIKFWTDRDRIFHPGEVITVDPNEVDKAQRSINKYGQLADLVPCGHWLIPLTFTLRVKE